MRILVTGGAGFIGANFMNMWVPRRPKFEFLNLDKLTYAANLDNLTVSQESNYHFCRGDIADRSQVRQIFQDFRPEVVINFAAESHVDQSIADPAKFITTNVNGTFNLIEEFKELWAEDYTHKRFHQVSTDEVYGFLGATGSFTEASPYQPSSPYSASKASADLLVQSYGRTFGVPISITNASNNFGPYQHPEKLIPKVIFNALRGEPIPLYGTGENVRDWLYVSDHCEAIWQVVFQAKPGAHFNVGADHPLSNQQLVGELLAILAEMTGKPVEQYTQLVQHVKDRPGHDFRYAIDASLLEQQLGWQPQTEFRAGLRATVDFYLQQYQKGKL
ncbi:dTDP-glucose 4,6-dehydratase [Pediococcus acidilactici]|uniref:dTDP-glucose 4,6-dehydratase n=1 Tax=Pediococcus acidilactici TaxID=1254 RepID=UPI003B42F552